MYCVFHARSAQRLSSWLVAGRGRTGLESWSAAAIPKTRLARERNGSGPGGRTHCAGRIKDGGRVSTRRQAAPGRDDEAAPQSAAKGTWVAAHVPAERGEAQGYWLPTAICTGLEGVVCDAAHTLASIMNQRKCRQSVYIVGSR